MTRREAYELARFAGELLLRLVVCIVVAAAAIAAIAVTATLILEAVRP